GDGATPCRYRCVTDLDGLCQRDHKPGVLLLQLINTLAQPRDLPIPTMDHFLGLPSPHERRPAHRGKTVRSSIEGSASAEAYCAVAKDWHRTQLAVSPGSRGQRRSREAVVAPTEPEHHR